MVRDMVSILGCPSRFDARYELLRAAVQKDKQAARRFRQQLVGSGGEDAAQALAERELADRGGFIPLMQHFPLREAYDRGYSLPWGGRDYRLALWMEENRGVWERQGGFHEQERHQQQLGHQQGQGQGEQRQPSKQRVRSASSHNSSSSELQLGEGSPGLEVGLL